jgi:glycerol uptake operon antiterminator
MRDLGDLLANNPIIPSVKDDSTMDTAIANSSELVLVLFGDILNIAGIIDRLKNSGKMVFVNVDLIEGLSSKNISVDYLKKNTRADGIISNRAPILKYAKELGFITVHRFFLIDSISFHNMPKLLEISNADILQILPGWPKVISWVSEIVRQPIIAGGLVCDREEVINALKAGADSISTSNTEIWEI